MLFEPCIVSKILAMHRKSSGITNFLPSNALSTTTLSFIKHSRMIRSFSFGPNRENGSGFLLQLCFFLGNPITVVSAPLGHPRFDIFGGITISNFSLSSLLLSVISVASDSLILFTECSSAQIALCHTMDFHFALLCFLFCLFKCILPYLSIQNDFSHVLV